MTDAQATQIITLLTAILGKLESLDESVLDLHEATMDAIEAEDTTELLLSRPAGNG